MALFDYAALSLKDRKVIQGTLQARDEVEARRQLREREYIPASLQPRMSFEQEQIPFIGKNEGLLSHSSTQNTFCQKSLNSVFWNQLHQILGNGKPLLYAIQQMGQRSLFKPWKNQLKDIYARLLQGNSLSSQLLKYTDIFSALEVDVISWGESEGRLEKAIELYQDWSQNNTQQFEQFVQPVINPLRWLLVILTGCLTLLLTALFSLWPSFGSDSNLDLLFCIITMSITGFVLSTSRLWPILHHPTLGHLFLQNQTIRDYWVQLENSQWLKRLEILHTVGMDSVAAAKFAAKWIQQPQIRQAYQGGLPLLEQGQPLANTLSKTDCYTETQCQLLNQCGLSNTLAEGLKHTIEYTQILLKNSTKTLQQQVKKTIFICLISIAFLSGLIFIH